MDSLRTMNMAQLNKDLASLKGDVDDMVGGYQGAVKGTNDLAARVHDTYSSLSGQLSKIKDTVQALNGEITAAMSNVDEFKQAMGTERA